MKKLLIASTWFAASLLVFASATALAQQTPRPAAASSAPAQPKPAKAPWGRIIMVGASASAGFTESEPMGGPNTAQYRLHRYLDAALLAPHEPVRNLASTLFFFQPEVEGRNQIRLTLQARPTLVVALDFLFWFCYGQSGTDAERLQHFEKGLKLLDAVQCPIILGDIPDASGADPDMLPPAFIPPAEVMSAANGRLKDWAAARKQVTILPLSQFMRTTMANLALSVHGHTLPDGQTQALLQTDRLHPSTSGCAVLAVTILDAFLSKQPARLANEIRWDPGQILRLGSKPAPRAQNNPAKSHASAASPSASNKP